VKNNEIRVQAMEHQDARLQVNCSRSILRPDLVLEAFNYRVDYDYSMHPNIIIGQMNKICLYCRALKFQKESPGMCCSNGKVNLPALEDPP